MYHALGSSGNIVNSKIDYNMYLYVLVNIVPVPIRNTHICTSIYMNTSTNRMVGTAIHSCRFCSWCKIVIYNK
jgi:hypothetical protein